MEQIMNGQMEQSMPKQSGTKQGGGFPQNKSPLSNLKGKPLGMPQGVRG
jgi:hypothetical protein